jgi:hypothetical protein
MLASFRKPRQKIALENEEGDDGDAHMLLVAQSNLSCISGAASIFLGKRPMAMLA